MAQILLNNTLKILNSEFFLFLDESLEKKLKSLIYLPIYIYIYIEHRYTHTEDIKYHDTGNGWTLATVSAWKNFVNVTVGGVGILIGPRALKTLLIASRE